MSGIDGLLKTVEWIPTGMTASESSDGLPYATHSGVLEIMGFKMRCHRLSTGQAIFDADDFNEFFERMLGE